MNTSHISDQKGLTLVELLLAVVVMGMVFATVASLMGVGAQTFALGESQSWLTMNTGAAVQIMTRRVRNATGLEILGTAPTTFDSSWWYLYVEDSSADVSRVMLRSTTGTSTAITDEIVPGDGLSFAARYSGSEVVLDVSLDAEYRSRERHVATSMILGNISSLPATTAGPAIRFKVPN
jgi:prepilin-type N-terminal cleavage/methylation domain-containing protein